MVYGIGQFGYIPPERPHQPQGSGTESFIPPAVVYYNTIDRPGDTQAVAYSRGYIAERLDRTFNRIYASTYLIGALSLSYAIDAAPIVRIGFITGAAAYACGAVFSYMQAVDTTQALIKKKQGNDFDGFIASQRCEGLEFTPQGEE